LQALPAAADAHRSRGHTPALTLERRTALTTPPTHPLTPPHSWKWSKPYAVQMAKSLMVTAADGSQSRVSHDPALAACAWLVTPSACRLP